MRISDFFFRHEERVGDARRVGGRLMRSRRVKWFPFPVRVADVSVSKVPDVRRQSARVGKEIAPYPRTR